MKREAKAERKEAGGQEERVTEEEGVYRFATGLDGFPNSTFWASI